MIGFNPAAEALFGCCAGEALGSEKEEAVKEGKKPEFKGEKKNPIKPKAKSTGTGKFDNKREAKSDSRGFGKKTETRGSKEGRSNEKRSSRGR